MKKYVLAGLILSIHISAKSQNVGIGDLPPEPSAKLHIQSENSG